MTVPGQSTVVYAYDNANRLTQITQGSSIVQFGYDNANRRTSLTLPNNILVEYAYDAASRVTGIIYKQNGTTVIGDLTYEYDQAGNRTKIGGTWARTGMPEPITSTTYDANNRQLTFGDKTLAYDDNGNLQSITDSNGTTLYSWNARNQLVSISGPSVNASFVYDGMGRREAKTVNGSLTEFLYDGRNPVQETSGAAVLSNVLTGLRLDEFLARTDVSTGITSSLLTDAVGSTIALADAAGVLQTEYTYQPFGKVSVVGASSSNPFQYTGREEDGTGLEYYRARYYGPAFQRFVSEDPIRFQSGDLNLFAYVGNNPINRFDPLGLAETCTWLGVNAGGCIGIGWQMLLEKGLCQDDCGKWKRRSRECLCFCVGAGLWAGASVSSGDASTSNQGWTVSVTPVISVSGDGLVPTGGGPGFGMLYTYQWCSCRVH